VSRLPLEGAVALAAVLFLAACTSALKEPPPVADIGEAQVRPPAEHVDAAAALLEAETELKKMPDAESVQRAQQLYLEAARLDEGLVEAFLGAARATAWLIEHEADGQRRKELAVEGVQIGQWCQRLHPEVIECTYRLALAVGQQARERSSTAVDGLDVMVELLEEVISNAPELDFAGGDRVLALVLLRAPGWPTGPGDPELGLEHARAAVEAFPDYPPNQLVLGEALLENGDRDRARRALEVGIELAENATENPEAADWAIQGEEALAKLR
jgi:tetratricopeptide (TPR) repeat protein